MFIFVTVVALVTVYAFWFMSQSKFGATATGYRLARVKQSPNYREGKFQNQHFTPYLKEGISYFTVTKDFFFNRSKQGKPASVIPTIKTNLYQLPGGSPVMVWFGHSSYYLQVDGLKILVDPVFSGNASPVSFTTKSFLGTDVYSVSDLPDIDYLFLSHDHWDHLDHATVSQLKNKAGTIVTGLGVGAHLEKWGFDAAKIIEKDWYEEVDMPTGFSLFTTPARHFSGRSLQRNQSLWLSFVLKTPNFSLYLGGDSGYDTHFANIGKQYGPFDVAILECGQYNEYWKYIHMMPEEVVQAAIDLEAKKFIPIHWSKFSMTIRNLVMTFLKPSFIAIFISRCSLPL